MNLQELKKRVKYKWRLQSAKYGKATFVAYIDARQVMDLLDDVLGSENWQDKYEVINGNLYCSIGIRVNENWVWKTDCGIESKMDKEKGESSDAFKRAAVKHGIGRFLYSIPIVTSKTKEYKGKEYPIDEKGDFLKGQKIQDYCNRKTKKQLPLSAVESTTQWMLKNQKTITDIKNLYFVSRDIEKEIIKQLKK